MDAANTPEPEYLTIAEARAILRVTTRQVYRLASEGKITTLQTPQGRLYRREDVEQLAADRGVSNVGDVVMQRGSELAQARQVAALLRQQAEVLARIEQRPADPELVERLARIEQQLSGLEARPAPQGPPPWFWIVLAGAAVLAALALLALALL